MQTSVSSSSWAEPTQNVLGRDFLRVLGWAEVVIPINVLSLGRKNRPTHVAIPALYGFKMKADTQGMDMRKGRLFLCS